MNSAPISRRNWIKGAAAVGAAASGAFAGRSAQAAAIELGMPGFPGPSVSCHSKVVIKGLKLDDHDGWSLRWETRPTSESYYNDFITGAYEAIDFGGLNVYANLYNKGVPLRVVQATARYPAPMVVRADGGIRSITDLAGKTLGVDRSSYIYAYVAAAAKGAGMNLEKDVKVENVGFFQAPPRFQRGEFDAVMMLFEHAIDLTNKMPDRYRIALDASEAFAKAIGIERAYQYQTVREGWLAKNPGAIKQVIVTYGRLGAAFKERPKEVVALLAKPTSERGAALDEKIATVEYITGTEGGLRTEWLSRPVASFADDIRKELEAYREIGLIQRVPDAKFLIGADQL